MKWIDIEDELPPPATMVLVLCDDDYDFGNLLAGKMKIFCMGDWKVMPGASITHWMHLPEKPTD